jgi:type II secretory pathway component PulK
MLFRAYVVGLLWTFCALLGTADAGRAAEDKKPEKKAEEGVVIDFSNWSVETDVDDVTFQIQYEGFLDTPDRYTGGNGTTASEFAQMYYELLKTAGVKVERFDKTKVRIIGWEDKDKVFRRAIKGTVTSKKLKAEQIPQVTNPGPKL